MAKEEEFTLENKRRYTRALNRLHALQDGLVKNPHVLPHWRSGSTAFWYVEDGPRGRRWRWVDVLERRARTAFDHDALISSLNKAISQPDAGQEPSIDVVDIDERENVVFHHLGASWTFEAQTKSLARTCWLSPPDVAATAPDGASAVYVRDHDLWIRDFSTGSERQLTSDGAPHFAYASLPDCRRMDARSPAHQAAPIAGLWSPDSRWILTYQTDERSVRALPFIEVCPNDVSSRPKAHEVRCSLPGDAEITQYVVWCIDAQSGAKHRVAWPALPCVRMGSTPIEHGMAWWSADGARAFLVAIDRGEQQLRLLGVDPNTGGVEVLFEECTGTYVDVGPNVYGDALCRYLPASEQLVWWSERSGWGHLYLFDLRAKAWMRAITSGEFVVRDILHVDEARRELLVAASGREAGRDLYHIHLYRVSLDGGEPELLTPESAHHQIFQPRDESLVLLAYFGLDTSSISGVSPDGAYFVDTYSTVDTPPRSVLRARDGELLMELSPADVSGLGSDWRWPAPIWSKGADGVTDIYGVLWLPSDFDAAKLYPVLDYVYGGPQVAPAPSGSFANPLEAMAILEGQALAELGFVVAMINGGGTALRDKAFHDRCYGKIESACDVEDRVAWLRRAAAERPFMDLSRVGTYGFSAGGYAAAGALLRRADFYSVGVAVSGNHDQRLFRHSWGERYQGLPPRADYGQQANAALAHQLRGKLLLIHGLLDAGVHPASTLQLAAALMQANKNFELILSPAQQHGIDGYALRRAWDFLLLNLAGGAPPDAFQLRHPIEDLIADAAFRQQQAGEFRAKLEREAQTQ